MSRTFHHICFKYVLLNNLVKDHQKLKEMKIIVVFCIRLHTNNIEIYLTSSVKES